MALQTFVKVRFGGELQWCLVTDAADDGLRVRVRVDNHPVADGAPFRSEHTIGMKDVLDITVGRPLLSAAN